MADDAPVIYGLEFQARSLAPQSAETELNKFFIGTQSLRNENIIYHIEFEDETNGINKHIYRHPDGEIWQITSSPVDKQIIATCYNSVSSTKAELKCSLWSLPPEEERSRTFDEPQSPTISLEKLVDLPKQEGDNFVNALWEPQGDGTKIAAISETTLSYLDLNSADATARVIGSTGIDTKPAKKFCSLRWNPHQNCNQVATGFETSLRLWDLRSMKSIKFIENAHSQQIRDMDFNPNRQYYLVTCGDDCKIKFWDIRQPDEPLKVLAHHSHWVWCVRYNQCHDQLILTGSSDSRVVLYSVNSLSSEPYGMLVGDDDENENDKENQKEPVSQEDRMIGRFEEHEDSVYAVEWSIADPWIFASLSYDGRLVINRVPRDEKFKILL